MTNYLLRISELVNDKLKAYCESREAREELEELAVASAWANNNIECDIVAEGRN